MTMQSLSLSSLTILFGALAVFCVSNSSNGCALVSAFSFSELVSKKATRATRQSSNVNAATTVLKVATTTRSTNGVAEEDARYIFHKAREFAFRDDFGDDAASNEYNQHYHSLSDVKAEIEESKFWLREIIHLQSGCVAGTLAAKDLCENQQEAAEIVGRLRRKIEIHEKLMTLRTKGSDSIVPTIATELSVGALLVVLAIFWTTLDLPQRHDDIPAMQNYQQWMSILKEKGYLLSLLQGGFWNL